MTDEILHVHHWHRRRIMCQDTKTVKEEDLPFINCCCRCNQEKSIEPEPKGTMHYEVPLGNQYTIDNNGDILRQAKLRKLEQKREFEGAAATLASYHARKSKKKLEMCERCTIRMGLYRKDNDLLCEKCYNA